jgi:Domain of unknown function (DUF1996)/Bacterial Ig-like domain (group 2)
MQRHARQLLSGATAVVLATAGCADSTSFTSLTAPSGGPDLARQAGAPVALTISPRRGSIDVGATLQLTDSATDRLGRLNSSMFVLWLSEDSSIARVSSTGVVTGLKPGMTRVGAAVGSLAAASFITVTAPVSGKPITAPAVTPPVVPPVTPPVVPPLTPPPATASSAGAWTYCSPTGTVCDFTGLRDVRLSDPTGSRAVVQTAYHAVPCAVYGFNGQNPAPGAALHCDYGPAKMTTLTNPMPGMGGLGATVVVPVGAPGVGSPQTTPSSDVPTYTDGSGSFRTTCSLVGYAFHDPIVFPGQPGASHLHQFFGNVSVNASSTPQSLAAAGNSTCRGGTLNRTTYWVPAVLDSRTGEVQTPLEGIFYYKTGYNMDPTTIQPLPAGLRMIAGDKNATGPQAHTGWTCRDGGGDNTGFIPTTCRVGDAVRMIVAFPQCWDGTNLDAPNHQSHMAYPLYRNPPQRSTCPATHPVPLPAITEHFDYPVTATSTPASWRLSSDMYSASQRGGLSTHADWMGAWDEATMRSIVTQCLNRALDCGVGAIGGGRALY